jgi:hypothetical protein
VDRRTSTVSAGNFLFLISVSGLSLQYTRRLTKALMGYKHTEATNMNTEDSNRGKPKPHKGKYKFVEFWER